MKRKIISAFILLSLFAGLLTYGITQYSYSRGVRSGKLVKLSKKGVLFKTYEGTLDLGSGDQLTWQFSVHGDDIGDELVKQTGKTVRLEYRELLFQLFYSTKYDVEGWRLEGDSYEMKYFCRLVDFLRSNASIVNFLRPAIEKEDPQLLDKIKECQK